MMHYYFVKGSLLQWLMFRDLKTFSNTSGLSTNITTLNVYSANIDPQCLANTYELTRYQKGRLPLIYLGVPISAKKSSNTDCEILVGKLVAKIRSWGIRHVSFIERVMLVNSVLMQMHTY